MSDGEMSTGNDPQPAPETPAAPALQPDPNVVTIVVKGSGPPPTDPDVVYLSETRDSDS